MDSENILSVLQGNVFIQTFVPVVSNETLVSTTSTGMIFWRRTNPVTSWHTPLTGASLSSRSIYAPHTNTSWYLSAWRTRRHGLNWYHTQDLQEQNEWKSNSTREDPQEKHVERFAARHKYGHRWNDDHWISQSVPVYRAVIPSSIWIQ